jgi:hypothetical protein
MPSSVATAYCASCKKLQPVTLIRGHNGARDSERCNGCLRTWPTGHARQPRPTVEGLGGKPPKEKDGSDA